VHTSEIGDSAQIRMTKRTGRFRGKGGCPYECNGKCRSFTPEGVRDDRLGGGGGKLRCKSADLAGSDYEALRGWAYVIERVAGY
jgi:hypothetical protein